MAKPQYASESRRNASKIQNLQVTVGTTRAQVVGNETPVLWAFVQADGGNTGNVFVGGSGVTNSGAGIGWRLTAGQVTSELRVSDLSAIYVIGSAAGQNANITYGEA